MKSFTWCLSMLAAGVALAGCGGMTVVPQAVAPEPPAAAQEQTVTGAVSAQDAKSIELGVRYRVLMDAAQPALRKQYFQVHLVANAPIVQRLKVVNLHPNQMTFSGRCTLYERNAVNQYALSLLKLGGAWKAEGEGGAQMKKVDVFSNADIVLEVAADAGAGYFEIDLERYY
jgi:hypothetical protein